MFLVSDADSSAVELISHMQCFESFRLVDPETDQVYNMKEGKPIPMHRVCYCLWGRDVPCSNCSSKRAISEKRQMVKFECLHGDVILIMSCPIVIEGHQYVLELAKTVTDSLVIHHAFRRNDYDVLTLVQAFNDLAVTDSYTALYNKKYIDQEIVQNVREAIVKGSELAAAVLDIDSFKDINDSYGHVSGDEVIKALAKELHKIVDGTAHWAGRMGGDEFLIVFKGIPFAEAQKICDTLCSTVANLVFCKDGHNFGVKISIGVKHFMPDEDNEKNFLDHADQKMYEAKRRLD